MTNRAPIAAWGRGALAAPLAALVLGLSVAGASALPLWADGDGDGLPDSADRLQLVEPSALVTVDVWVDSQSFLWTNFQIWMEHGTALEYASGVYLVTGGNTFPVDNYSSPTVTAIGGFTFMGGRHGATRLARLSYHVTRPGSASVSFVTDPDVPDGGFSSLGTRTGYFLFEESAGTRWVSFGVAGEDASSWRLIKGLYE